MSQDIKVKAAVTHRTIKSTGKVGFIRSVDESEPYTGSYDITVLNTTVLPTDGKRMTSDLTVRQGAETYTGATTVNAEFTDVVLNTQNKLVQSNITVKQGIPKYTGPYSMRLDLPGTHNFAVKDKYCDKNIQVVQPFVPYGGPMNFTVIDSTIVQVFANEWINGVMFINQGIPLYEGSTSFTIVDSGLTIATNGKRLNSDITVDISALEALAEEISEVVG
jgi:hypothetical protein